ETAARVKTARVVHHDGHLTELPDVVERPRKRFLTRFLPDDDLYEWHAIDGREKVNAYEVRGALRCFRQPRDRQRRSVAREDCRLWDHTLRFLSDLGLDRPALKNRLDNQVAAGEL